MQSDSIWKGDKETKDWIRTVQFDTLADSLLSNFMLSFWFNVVDFLLLLMFCMVGLFNQPVTFGRQVNVM